MHLWTVTPRHLKSVSGRRATMCEERQQYKGPYAVAVTQKSVLSLATSQESISCLRTIVLQTQETCTDRRYLACCLHIHIGYKNSSDVFIHLLHILLSSARTGPSFCSYCSSPELYVDFKHRLQPGQPSGTCHVPYKPVCMCVFKFACIQWEISVGIKIWQIS